MQFIEKVQENDTVEALEIAERSKSVRTTIYPRVSNNFVVLEYEPDNQTMQEFIPALRKKRKIGMFQTL